MAIVNIPFSGFYESIWSGEIDHVEARDAEYMAEMEREQPEEIRLSESDFNEILFDCADYSAAYDKIARDYADSFDSVVSTALGIPLGLKFDGMDSPREYNFTTDRIHCEISDEAVAALFALSQADNHAALDAMIKERHTSRDGFCSYYSNSLAQWLGKPLDKWDHNELGTLLRAMMKRADMDRDLHYSIFDGMADVDCFYQAWQDCVDWKKFEERVADKRADLIEELAAENPEYEPQYRCPHTLDLFGGRHV